MNKATRLAHFLVKSHLSSREHLSLFAIDATVGNGFDTLFLAECVGEKGVVIGFDIHEMLEASQRLEQAGVSKRVQLCQQGHETMLEVMQTIMSKSKTQSGIHAIMFNLGYLPRGDTSTITRPHTTLEALQQSIQLLASGGILTIACYRGHDGGNEETELVIAWARGLPQEEYSVIHNTFINKRGTPPELLAVYKR
jgi:predicted methyltransferase